MPTVEGNILMIFWLRCPHCSVYLDNDSSSVWFSKTMGADFPSSTEEVEGDYEAECPNCKKEFTIKGFTQ